MTVIEHVPSRLNDIGVNRVIGVPGDFAFPVNDAVCSHPQMQWIGCCDELNAAYATDGYPRTFIRRNAHRLWERYFPR